MPKHARTPLHSRAKICLSLHCGGRPVSRKNPVNPVTVKPEFRGQVPEMHRPRNVPKRQKQSTAKGRRSRSSRTPGSKNDVHSGNFDAGDKRRRRWKLPGLALVTTSSAGSAYDASSTPQPSLLLKGTQPSPLRAASSREQAGRSSVSRPYRRYAQPTRLHADDHDPPELDPMSL